MGFDLGALLRSGAAGMAGYGKGQQEAEDRRQAAQRAALSDALLRSQITNQRDAVTSRGLTRTRNEGVDARAATALGVTQENEQAEADYWRSKYPGELGQVANNATAISVGKDMFTQEQALARDQQRPRTEARPPAAQSDSSVYGRLRSDVTRNLRNRESDVRGSDTFKTQGLMRMGEAVAAGTPIDSLPPMNALTAQDTTNALAATRAAFPEVSDEQWQPFEQSFLGQGEGDEDLTSLSELVQELERKQAEADRELESLRSGRR